MKMNEGYVEDNWQPRKDRLDEIAAKRDQLEREISMVHRIVKDAVENRGR